jgi:hypothetical protein
MDKISRYVLLKKEFLIPYYHNKAESKNGLEKNLTFTLNWGENTKCAFFLIFQNTRLLICTHFGDFFFDIYKRSKVILQAEYHLLDTQFL